MKKTITILAIVILLIISFSLLTTAVMEEPQNQCSENSQRVCELLNTLEITQGQSVPFILPRNGVINTYFSNEELIGYITIKDGVLQEWVCCTEHENPTHNAKIKDYNTIEELKNSEDPLKTATEKTKKKEITIQAKSLANKARLTIGRAIMRIASWF